MPFYCLDCTSAGEIKQVISVPSTAQTLGDHKQKKENSTGKNIWCRASIMVLDRVIQCGNDSSKSVYDSRGLLFI